MKTILKSSYPCLVKGKNSYHEIDKNDLLEMADEDIIFVYPQCSGQIPFYINLVSPVENSNFSIIQKENQQIFFLEPKSNVQIVQKTDLYFSNAKCKIEIAENTLCIDNESKKISYTCPHSCAQANIFKHKNFACVQFPNDFYIFDTTKNKLTHFGGDEIKFENGTIFVQKKFHDSLNHEKTYICKLSDKIETEKEDFSQDFSPDISSDLLPYKIMESVKIKDYQFLMQNLSENLKNSLKNVKFDDFFENFNNFLPLSTTEFITISNKTKNYVSFSLNNNLVDDISIDRL